MSGIEEGLKGLNFLSKREKILGEVDAGHYQTYIADTHYSKLWDSHPSLEQSGANLYSGKVTKYLYENANRPGYAITQMSPSEFFKVFGTPDVNDPVIRKKAKQYLVDLTSGNGINDVIVANGRVGKDGGVDIEGVDGQAIALAMMNVEGFQDKIPVMIKTPGYDWSKGPGTFIRYQGRTSGTLDLPKYTGQMAVAKRPPMFDPASPTWFDDQPRDTNEARQKLTAAMTPDGQAEHASIRQKVNQLKASGFVDAEHNTSDFTIAAEQGGAGNASWRAGATREIVAHTNAKLEMTKAFEKNFFGSVSSQDYKNAFGEQPLYIRAMLGDKDEATKNLPLLFTRTDKYRTVVSDAASLSRAQEDPFEFGLHIGEPTTHTSFQSNPILTNADKAKRTLQDPNATQGARIAATARVREFKSGLDPHITTVSTNAHLFGWKSSADIEKFYADAALEWEQQAQPGQRTVLGYAGGFGQKFLAERLAAIAKPGLDQKAINHMAFSLTQVEKWLGHGGDLVSPVYTGKLKKPLVMYDIGNWEPERIGAQLKGMAPFKDKTKEIDQALNLGSKEMTKALQKIIESKGFDHIAYMNNAEGLSQSGAGQSLSLILWKPEQLVEPLSFQRAKAKRTAAAVASVFAGAKFATDPLNPTEQQ